MLVPCGRWSPASGRSASSRFSSSPARGGCRCPALLRGRGADTLRWAVAETGAAPHTFPRRALSFRHRLRAGQLQDGAVPEAAAPVPPGLRVPALPQQPGPPPGPPEVPVPVSPGAPGPCRDSTPWDVRRPAGLSLPIVAGRELPTAAPALLSGGGVTPRNPSDAPEKRRGISRVSRPRVCQGMTVVRPVSFCG